MLAPGTEWPAHAAPLLPARFEPAGLASNARHRLAAREGETRASRVRTVLARLVERFVLGPIQRVGVRAFEAERVLRLLVLPELREWPSGPSSLRERLALWRRGFAGRAAAFYPPGFLARAGDYANDLDRARRSWRINGRQRVLLEDKLLFATLLGALSERVAPVLGSIEKGRFRALPPDPDAPPPLAVDHLASRREVVFLKPRGGSRGDDVLAHEMRGDAHVLSGSPLAREALQERLARGSWIVCPRIQQRGPLAAVYPDAVNTLRLLTLLDETTGRPFLAAAFHRFGTRRSAPVDNFIRGGVLAGVDLGSGVLGKAALEPDGAPITWVGRHPDTNMLIEGIRVPGWESLVAEILALAERLPFLPYVAWDVAVSDDGFQIVEANSDTDLEGYQMLAPLLADERVRRFYETQGVVR